MSAAPMTWIDWCAVVGAVAVLAGCLLSLFGARARERWEREERRRAHEAIRARYWECRRHEW